ncbi:MAG: hypothetical protein KC550_04320, partial [Nanoarchaeota archaeon]|nr:hypothetical protein [Nanoarchaeota archaeon]
MDKNNLSRNITFLFVFVLFIIGINADSNGVWNRAEDMRPGIIGGDENSGDFAFNSSLFVLNGNVAIGINHSLAKFKVFDTYSGSTHSEVTVSGGSYGFQEIYSHGPSDDGNVPYLSFHRGQRIGWQQGLLGNKFVIASGSGANTEDLFPNRILTITNDSNVGIGTITPTAKLDIIGDVKAHNIFTNGELVATQNDLTDLENNVANNYFNKTQSDARYVNEGQVNSITSNMLVDGTIGIVDIDIAQLDARFVNENQVNSISSNMIVDNSITNNDIQDGTIGIADIDIAQLDARFVNEGQVNSITSNMIIDGSVRTGDIQDGTIRIVDVNTAEFDGRYIREGIGNINLDDIDTSVIQRRILTNCPAGQSIRQINVDGTVICEVDDSGIGACPCGACWSTVLKIKTDGMPACYTGHYRYEDRLCTPSGWKVTGATSCESDSSTPYLFSFKDGQYYIENDVMQTTFDQNREVAMSKYENDDYETYQDKKTDLYLMKINPDIVDGIIKLKLDELEPEESNYDEIKLHRIVHDKNSNIVIDYNSDEIKLSSQVKLDNMVSCDFKSSDCLDEISGIDNENLIGDYNDEIEFKFDVSGLDGEEVYLMVNSWDNGGILPPQLNPLEGYSACGSFRTILFDVNNDGNYVQMKDLHPREIESAYYLDISDVVSKASSNEIGIKIVWTQEHTLDYIGMILADKVKPVVETFELSSAVHSNGDDILDLVLVRDKNYAHTVRGEFIELEFSAQDVDLGADEKVSFVFESSGFYHGLRVFEYPEISLDGSFIDEIHAYLRDIEENLGKEFVGKTHS